MKKFDMKDLGDASFVLGIQIHRDCSRGILGLSQKSSIKKVLKRLGKQDCKLGDTPVTKGSETSSVSVAEDSLCVSHRESDVCSGLYTSGYYVHCWDAG